MAGIASTAEPWCLARPLFSKNRLSYRHPLQRVRCAVSTEKSTLTTETRRSANYKPSTWSYEHLQSLVNDTTVEQYKDRAEKLEAQVRSTINDENTELLTLLELIDDVKKLGLEYRFQSDIRRALERYVSLGAFNAKTTISLHATALSFRLLRQHGLEVSQDVFNEFTDQNGNFMEVLKEDVKGMLSLYEASYLAFEGENLLDEAKAFSRTHLKDLQGNIDKNLAEQVKHALELPSHHRTNRLEAQWNIEAYRKREDANKVALELAILDFNMVQSMYQKDLRDTARWWRSRGLATKLSFARDRLMECFFWAVGMVYEPQYSNCRQEIAKVFALITLFDDVYDVYGTLDELELLTDAIERWDINAINNLPDYMKLCFLALYNTVNERVYETLKEKGENALPYLKKAWADVCKAFLQEAKWFYNKQTPIFEEYIENGWRSSSGPVQLVHALFSLDTNVTKEELDSLENYHDLLRWPSIIFRLCNDLVSAPAELERGETVNSVFCYMQKTGLDEGLASEQIRKAIDDAWKKLNKEKVYGSVFTQPFVETAFNLARVARCTYQYGDEHSSPDDRSRKRVLSVIIEPLPLIS